VVGREVKDRVDVLGDLVRELPVFEIPAVNLDGVLDRTEVLLLATGEVVGDDDVGAFCNEILNQMRPDERRAAGDEHPLAVPGHRSAPPSATAS